MIDEYKDLIDEENRVHYVNIPGSTTLSNSNITVKCEPRYKSLIGYKFDVILIDEMDEELKSNLGLIAMHCNTLIAFETK